MTTKTVKTEMIEVTMSTEKGIKTNVDIRSNGLDCFDESKPIRTAFTSLGAIIVHDCDSIFFRADNILIQETISENGTDYIRITFKK